MSSTSSLHIALLHPDEKQRTMLSRALSSVSASLTAGAQWSDIASYPLRLGGIWLLFDQGEATKLAIRSIRTAQEQAFWGILIIGQNDTEHQQQLRSSGADTYLKYPFDFNILTNQIKAITEKYIPISQYQVLPAQVASGLDRLWAHFDRLNYYQILELEIDAPAEEVQARFHQRSLILHPDRHRSLKKNCPPVYERINLIYKRALEAYRVLSDSLQRPLYDAALSTGRLRWDYTLEEHQRSISNSSQQADTQLALAQALSLRSRGLLKPAYERMVSISQKEPENQKIKQLILGYQKLIELASREPEIASVIQLQVAP